MSNGAKTGAVEAQAQKAERQLAWLVESWTFLDDESREAILDVARGCCLSTGTTRLSSSDGTPDQVE
ncbi:MAG: hypothetical protein HQ518_15370 [Rhodopirellula sp.]|nr:hypothetical protein [Rhodopirellula sp.]